MTRPSLPRLVLVTGLAMAAFAANSLLCRMALRGGLIDPASFTALRLAAGALLLWPLPRRLERRPPGEPGGGSWPSAVALFAYAIAFSWAYVTLDTGVGALILFGTVQLTMIGVGILRGERPRPPEWLGALAACAGLVYLVSPGLTAPDPWGAASMALAGIAWGVYSLRGRGATRPVSATAGNFLRAAPLALLPLLAVALHVEPRGALLALVSGAITSGLGYVVWYSVLPHHSPTTAAVVQLTVPVLAGLGGVLALSEALSARLLVSSVWVLGGVALALTARRR